MVKKREIYTGYEAEHFLSTFVPVSKSQLVNSIDEISIELPLVLKIISKDALHKTEIGGVKIAKSKHDLQDGFQELQDIARNHHLKLDGIMVQKFYEGEQLIIGIKKDAVFGHIILFGLGGIFTEVLDDISIRKCPITMNDAQEMIDELKAKKIFYGFRGKQLNREAIKKTLFNMSKVPGKFKNIEELDINPFIVNEKEGVVVDARIVFSHV